MAQHAGVVRGSKKVARPASAEAQGTDWTEVADSAEFQELVQEKRSFIIPATIFFVCYYFALPILVGYFPGLMSTNVIGHINLAYLFALSQFFMAWILMAMYVKRARVFDALAAKIVALVKGGR